MDPILDKKELEERLRVFEEKLEEDEGYQMSDEMQEEYYILEESIEMHQSESLEKRFRQLDEEYETPKSVEEGNLNMMFPDSDGEFEID